MDRQTIATIQLDPEMASRYRDIPLLLDWVSGFYIFPVSNDISTSNDPLMPSSQMRIA
jgi:hypothetical protein